MKISRRVALILFMLALLVILAIGFYRAVEHEDPRPRSTAPATASAWLMERVPNKLAV